MEKAAYSKITRRLIPFLFLCYGVAYLDRVNLGFAKLEMASALGLSDTVYGTGAGIFFIGYFIFGVPSNLVLHRVGARRWIGLIMFTWGLVSGAMIFTRSAFSFFALRFLLGVAEAGFFPGIIYYLTTWFPSAHRARIVALFMVAIPISNVAGGPISGWILHAFGSGPPVHGLAAWQWLFILEAVPALVLGVASLFFLHDRLEDAAWLSPEEKGFLRRQLETDSAGRQARAAGQAFRNLKTWWLVPIYFGPNLAVYGVVFWLPTLIKLAGVNDPFHIGLLTTLPWAAAAVAMILAGRSSDRTGERRWHVATAILCAAAGLIGTAAAGTHLIPSLAALSLATAGAVTTSSLFWTLPTAFLDEGAAAAGIALINALGNLGGFGGPFLLGWIRDLTHSSAAGLCVLAAFALGSALLTIAFPASSPCPSRSHR